MRAIDTNVVVRLLARDDPKQTSRAEAFVAEGAWVSGLVLAESVWVLESVYAFGKPQLKTAISMLLEHRQLQLQDADVVRSALNDFEHHTSVGFTDCLVVAVAQKHGYVPVGTFDKGMARLTGAKGL